MAFCHFHAFRQRLHIPGHQQRRAFIGKEPVEDHGPLGGGELLQVAFLHIADDLQTHGLKVVEISRQLQAGTGHVGHGQADGLVIRGGKKHLQMKPLHHIRQGHAVFF